MSAPFVVVDAEVGGRPGTAVRCEGGLVTEVGPTAIVDRRGADVLDAAGGALVPGLHDHHLHLLALAARLGSVDLDAAATPAHADALMAGAPPGPTPTGWIRVAAYDEHRHGPLDRHRLDRLRPGARVRVQHRTGLSWVVSTAGLEALGIDPDRADGRDPVPDPRPGDAATTETGVERGADGAATGWLHRLDRWLGARVGRTPPALAPVGAHLAALGVTGVTDTTPVLDDDGLAHLLGAHGRGELPQRLVVLGRSGDGGLDGGARLGPVKLVADEHVGLDLDTLVAAVAAAHAAGRGAALHCVTRAECVAAATALLVAGPRHGDRLEHAAVLPRSLDPDLAAAGVAVVVQPALLAERGDHHLAEVDPEDHPDLHRHASMRAAGVAVVPSSDAPVATADPWAAMVAARDRRTRRGVVLGPGEAVAPLDTLAGYLRPALDLGAAPRRIVPGAPADLCALAWPLDVVGDRPDAGAVVATVVGGRVVHG